jgi:hypothetical protein
MTPENELIDKIRHYFNIVITPQNKERLTRFIEEYKSSLPAPQPVVKEKVKIVVREKIKAIVAPLRAYRTYLPQVAKYIQNKHGITAEELRSDSPSECYKAGVKGDGRKRKVYIDARKEFAKVMRTKYGASLRSIGEYLGYKSPENAALKLLQDTSEVVSRPELIYISKAIQIRLQGLSVEICYKHNISAEQLKVNSPNEAYPKGKQTLSLMKARREFAERASYEYKINNSAISRFLGYKTHTSVLNLLDPKSEKAPKSLRETG